MIVHLRLHFSLGDEADALAAPTLSLLLKFIETNSNGDIMPIIGFRVDNVQHFRLTMR